MGYNPWYRQIGKYFYLSNVNFIVPCEKSLSKLSENHTLDQQYKSYWLLKTKYMYTVVSVPVPGIGPR